MRLLNISGELYLSFIFLKEMGVSERTIEKWSRINGVVKDGKFSLINYNNIPLKTKAKLPSEPELIAMLASEKKSSEVTTLADKLKYAQINHCSKYRAYYKDRYNLASDEAIKAAMKRAVWERLMELYTDAHSSNYNGGLKKGALEQLFAAYNAVYPGQYSLKHAFLRTIKAVKSAGIDSIIVDKRRFRAPQTLKYNELHKYFIKGLLSIGKAYSAPQILQKITPMCKEAGVLIPSLTWVKSFIQEQTKITEYGTRYGADKLNKLMPFADMQPALHADKQWQVDGWNLPFYFKNENDRLDKLTLIAVRDAYSKMIVGYSISRSENRISILEAFQDAISNTGCLPYEIVVDNHSFNKTKEAENFIDEIKKIGVTWTVTENPQHKAIAERYFRNIGEQFCKDHYGYVGQGVKSREKNAHTSPELLQQYIKANKILTEAEIQLIGITVVKQFNQHKLNGYNETPERLYQLSEKPARFEIDLYERLRILTKRTEHKVSRGQITIQIAGTKHSYQLSAQYYSEYNGKKVVVRYDTPELIYLFDIKTDKPICSLKHKAKIHGAIADQTEADILLLAKNKGRVKGIITQARNEAENLVNRALEHHPEAIEILHRWTTPKDVLKMAETDNQLRSEAEKRGINLSLVAAVPKTTEITNPLYLGKKQTRKERSPFTPKNHVISVLEPVNDIDNQ